VSTKNKYIDFIKKYRVKYLTRVEIWRTTTNPTLQISPHLKTNPSFPNFQLPYSLPYFYFIYLKIHISSFLYNKDVPFIKYPKCYIFPFLTTARKPYVPLPAHQKALRAF